MVSSDGHDTILSSFPFSCSIGQTRFTTVRFGESRSNFAPSCLLCSSSSYDFILFPHSASSDFLGVPVRDSCSCFRRCRSRLFVRLSTALRFHKLIQFVNRDAWEDPRVLLQLVKELLLAKPIFLKEVLVARYAECSVKRHHP